MKRPRLLRCKGIDRRGIRCGRSASRPGESYCHLHRPRITVAAVEAVIAPIADVIKESENTNGPEQQHDQPAGTSAIVPEPPAVSTDSAAAISARPEQVAAARVRYHLTDDQCKQAGLVKLTKDGRWTSMYGDDLADQILDGTIPFEEAALTYGASAKAFSKAKHASFFQL